MEQGEKQALNNRHGRHRARRAREGGSASLSLGAFSKDHPLRWKRTDSTPEEKSSVRPTYVVFLLDGARGSELPSDFHCKYLALVDSSGPVQWTQWCWATWTMPVTRTQDDLNSAVVFPLVFQTPKLEGMGKRKKNITCAPQWFEGGCSSSSNTESWKIYLPTFLLRSKELRLSLSCPSSLSSPRFSYLFPFAPEPKCELLKEILSWFPISETTFNNTIHLLPEQEALSPHSWRWASSPFYHPELHSLVTNTLILFLLVSHKWNNR